MGKKLYVGNIGPKANRAALEALFAYFGTVENAYIIVDRRTGKSKGFGFVEMSSEDEAQTAMAALDGQDHGGRALKVNLAKPRENRSRGGGGYNRY